MKIIPHNKYLKEIEKPDAILACSDKSMFDDNIEGNCDECSEPIVYRPYNKKATKKVCLDCSLKYMEGENMGKKPKKK